MQAYLQLLQDILENGEHRPDRTGTGTTSVFGRQIRFDLSVGFPAVTTKKLAFNACKSELIWFLEGSQDERRLAEILHGTRDTRNTTIWTANAQSDYWVSKSRYQGDLGRIYGVQWRTWNNVPQYIIRDGENGSWTSDPPRSVDQIQNLIDGLKNDPYGRRHIISAWNVAELDQMALPPCHVMSQYYVSSISGKLSCQMYQRSQDVLLGAPFNIASYALLTHMLAQVCGLDVGELIVSIGDCHLYQNHIDQAKVQLTREPLSLPTLWLNPEILDINDFKMDDIKLINYQSHPALPAPMAV